MTGTDDDLPPSLTRLTFHGPLSETRAARLIERLARTSPGTILDIGCGWGELMLRLLDVLPDATGLGLDSDEGDLIRGRENARVRGLAERVTFARESAVGTTRGPADLVLCVGASQALTQAQPPELIVAALTELRRLVTPGGRVLLGEGFWPRCGRACPPANSATWPASST
jgi:cyclopropane fatty-acyl-phospholipid synthase-like methyltransferase